MKKIPFTWSLFTIAALALSGTAYAAEGQTAGLTAESGTALKHLANRYADASKGFMDAAESADDQALAAELRSKAEERKAYREELLAKSGLTTEGTDGTIEAGAHRAWLNLKAEVTGKNDLAIVRTVRAGEEEAVKSFSDLLGQPLPADLRDTVQDQYEVVLESYKWAGDEIIRRVDENPEAGEAAEDAKDEAKNAADDAENAAQDAGSWTENQAEGAKDRMDNARG